MKQKSENFLLGKVVPGKYEFQIMECIILRTRKMTSVHRRFRPTGPSRHDKDALEPSFLFVSSINKIFSNVWASRSKFQNVEG